MIDLLDSGSNSVQIILALLVAMAFFVAATSGYARGIFIALVIMIPFQPISSLYGTINMAITYLLAPAILLNTLQYKSRRLQDIPLIVPFALILMAMLISWSVAPTYKLFKTRYFLYLIQMGSNLALFYMSYAFFRKEHDLEVFFKALIFSNILVVLYCLMQLFVGAGQMSVLGVSELSIQQNRADQRLVGPFLAAGITAEYLVIQSLILGHYILRTGKFYQLGIILLLGNFAILVGTGNRGGFLCALLAAPTFLYFNRRYIGARGAILGGFVLIFVMLASSFLMVKYTNYNVLFTRLAATELDGVTPETRSGWSFVIEQIMNRPVTGHGPNIVRISEFIRPPTPWPKAEDYLRYFPHSLYLWILYTTGIVGLLAYGTWAARYLQLLFRERKKRRFSRGVGLDLPTLGIIIFGIFLIDQFKVEFLRFNLLDYQHYIAALFGMFAAIGNIPSAEESRLRTSPRGLLNREALQAPPGKT